MTFPLTFVGVDGMKDGNAITRRRLQTLLAQINSCVTNSWRDSGAEHCSSDSVVVDSFSDTADEICGQSQANCFPLVPVFMLS